MRLSSAGSRHSSNTSRTVPSDSTASRSFPPRRCFASSPIRRRMRRLIWEPRYGDIASSGDLGYLTGPVRRIVPGQNNGQPFHSLYASIWKRQPDGSFKVVMDMGVPTPGPVAFADGFMPARRTDVYTSNVTAEAAIRVAQRY